MTVNRNGLEKKLLKWWLFLQPYLLIVFIVFLFTWVIYSTIHFSAHFLPTPASKEGREVAPAFNVTAIITGFTFFLTQALLFFFAFRFRSLPGRTAHYIRNFFKLELFWVAVPAVVFIFFFVWGQVLWVDITGKAPADALNLEVMGAQWSWRVRYPGADHKLGDSDFKYVSTQNPMGMDLHDPHSVDDFVPVQMHLPVGKPVHLTLWSRDVIHSFFIPHLRVKMDAVPGMTTQLHFTPSITTDQMRKKLNDPSFNYEIACAELCGRLHFAMKMILVVDTPAEYKTWAAQQQSWMASHKQNLRLIHE